MKLSQWVESVGGRVKAADLLGLDPSTLWYWLKAVKSPSFVNCLLIEKASGGKVTMREILEETGKYAKAARAEKLRHVREKAAIR